MFINKSINEHLSSLACAQGGASLDLKAVQPKPFRWVLDITWLNLVELSKLQQFNTILDQITENEKDWRLWFEKDKPEEVGILTVHYIYVVSYV